jgi:glyoxylase-like metal-dependent hydrolase (beta-lactamase superfamily II)
MTGKRFKPLKITENFYQLGTSSFPAYISTGEKAMIIEGGTGATTAIIIDQIKELGIEPRSITYLVLTHTHSDHIGAIPHLKKLWPHLKIAAHPLAIKLLQQDRTVKDFIEVDKSIIRIMLAKGDIQSYPPELEKYSFQVHDAIEEGDKLDLGAGIIWTVYNTPGHSSCHISLFEESEKTLVIGDATGFYVPEKDVFWPNYFESLEIYCKSIRKLATLPAQRAALSHNGVIEGNVEEFLHKAMKTTEKYHHEMMSRLAKGEDPLDIAIDKARWVNSLTDIQTFEVMRKLARTLITRSHSETGKENMFSIPRLIKCA